MKKYLFLGFILFFCPIFVQAKHVVAIGDSITSGYGVEEKESYVQLFCEGLTKETGETTQCINLAVNGQTSSQLVGMLQNDDAKKTIGNSDYILMSIGGNDFLQELTSNLSFYLSIQTEYPQLPILQQQLTHNVTLILDQIYEWNPHAKIFVVPLYNPYVVFLKKNTTLTTSFDRIKEEFVKTVQKYPQVTITPDLSATLEREEYLNVSLTNQDVDPHPNRLGHDAIAKVMLEEVKEPTTVEKKVSSNFIWIFGVIVVLLSGLWYYMKR